jgi:hypothetical protein
MGELRRSLDSNPVTNSKMQPIQALPRNTPSQLLLHRCGPRSRPRSCWLRAPACTVVHRPAGRCAWLATG